ncbi:hypothetical protein [Streptomyces sp. NPDC046727]|uniref:hypothetical protein n=1 Tax=Streptomyces sp. NPDC046727 TaxID=3155373 RepID=UPI003401473A
MVTSQHFDRDSLFEQARAEGRKQGLIQGRQEMIVSILEWRGIPVIYGVRERVKACSNLELLELWAKRALLAPNPELFTVE